MTDEREEWWVEKVVQSATGYRAMAESEKDAKAKALMASTQEAGRFEVRHRISALSSNIEVPWEAENGKLRKVGRVMKMGEQKQ